MTIQAIEPGPAARPRGVEWPTWIALVACYTVWGAAVAWHEALGLWFALPAAFAVAFHSSLQHEMLHGHPTRNPGVNEALVFLPLGLVYPYRRFRLLHLRHHCDERLTDPYDDPESWYVAQGDYARMPRLMRAALAVNATFLGRVLIGPALSIWGFWRAEWRLARAGDAGVRDAWVRHALGLVPLGLILWAAGLPLWTYAALAAYPGLSLIAIRTFIEHRADADPRARTAVVEAEAPLALLFLNNNLHRVHHERPAVAWYLLPALWRANRDRVLADNGHYLVRGYREVLWRWAIRRREPIVHPLLRRLPADAPAAARDRAA